MDENLLKIEMLKQCDAQVLNIENKSEQTILLSLVICTRNRAMFLPQHFESLMAIKTDIAWEIIFVDNNSTDETPILLAEFAAKSSIPVTVVHEKITGLSNARNAGWIKAQANIVGFTDDDCYPAPDYVDSLIAAFKNESTSFVGGRVLLHDPEDLPWTIMLSMESQHFAPFSYIRPGTIHGANFAFRKSELQKLSGFDPLMGSGTPFPCEDCDVLLRALSAGQQGNYCPEIVVSHHHRRREVDKPKIERAYLAGRAAFFMKALVDAQKPSRIAYQWLRSAKYFGLTAFVQEIFIGTRYLLARRKSREIR